MGTTRNSAMGAIVAALGEGGVDIGGAATADADAMASLNCA